MLSGNRIRCLIVPFALAGAVLAGRVCAEDARGTPTILIPDRANSTAMIDAEGWVEPIEVRVVTLSDKPILSISPENSHPSALARIATTIMHPVTGEPIEINIVEIARRVGLLERGRRGAAWVANNELPFTRASEIAFALDGLSIRRIDDVARSADDQVVGWFSGTPIVELHVLYDAERTRANYGIQLVTPDVVGRKGHGPLSNGGDPGGSPGPPPGGGSNGPGSQGSGGGPVCGGDPGGSPDLPPCDEDPNRRGGR